MIGMAKKLLRNNLSFQIQDINYLNYNSQFDLVFSNATRTAMSLYHVPHIALGAEMSEDYHERSALVRLIVGAEGREIEDVERLFETPDAPRVREALDGFFEEVRLLRGEVEADGAEFAVVVFPFRYFDGNDVGRADPCAKTAGNTHLLSVFVAPQNMRTAIAKIRLPFLLGVFQGYRPGKEIFEGDTQTFSKGPRPFYDCSYHCSFTISALLQP